jgi:hypothetical protein
VPWTCGCGTSRRAATATDAQLESHLGNEEVLTDDEHNMLVHALNERFSDMDLDHPIPYRT